MGGTFQEVAVTCCLNDPVASAYMWDVQTGTSLMTYRGEPVTPVGVSLLSGEYVVAALQDKPFLRVWPVNSQQALNSLRLVCPGRVTHAQVSPDSCYIALTVAEKLHIYQLASGRLLGTGARHYQRIKVVQWSPDGSTIVCGGEDGLVTVWPLETIVASSSPEPQNMLSDHSLAVTDLKVSTGSRPRLLSVSIDRTCKVYDLYQGTLLVSLVFDQPLTAVCSGALDTDVFVGTANGTVWQVCLLSPPRHLEFHVTTEGHARQFAGHTKTVQCLSTSLTGELLMSGSSDGSVMIWHIASCQCLRTFPLKGPVTNAFFAPKPKQLFDNELNPSVVLNSFQSGNSEVETFVHVINNESLTLCDTSSQELFPPQTSDSSEERVQALKTDITLLKSINSNLYQFSIDKIICNNNLPPRPLELKNQNTKNKNNKNLNKKVFRKLNAKKALKQTLNNGKKKGNQINPPKRNGNEIFNRPPTQVVNTSVNFPMPNNYADKKLKKAKDFKPRSKQRKRKDNNKIPTSSNKNNTSNFITVVNGGMLTNKRKRKKNNKQQ